MTSLSYSIQSASGVEYKDMLFFDNMEDNISDITTLGEYSQWNQVYWPLLLSGTHKLFYEAMADSVNAIIIGSSVRKTFSVPSL